MAVPAQVLKTFIIISTSFAKISTSYVKKNELLVLEEIIGFRVIAKNIIENPLLGIQETRS